MNKVRIITRIIAFSIPLFLLSLILAYSVITQQAGDNLYDSIKDLPSREVGLLLGTSPRTRKGTASEFFQNRIEAAVVLYRSGRIRYILASGDNSSMQYNEPIYMQKELMARGIPADRIVLDYAGFSTLDSVIRARKVFGQEDPIIISQRFHNERALYIAASQNMNAVAYNAKDVGGVAGLSVLVREVLARVKALLDVHILNRTPKFLGDPEAIPPLVVPENDM